MHNSTIKKNFSNWKIQGKEDCEDLIREYKEKLIQYSLLISTLSAENIELRKGLDQALSSETFSSQNQQLRETLLLNEKKRKNY
jgi:hypothetical protein